MKVSGKSPWLAGAIATLAAFVGGIVVWGQVRTVRVPQPYEWAHVAPMCADPEVGETQFAHAVTVLLANKLQIRQEAGPCPGRAAIHVRVSAAEVERLWPSSEAMGEFGQITGSAAAEAFDLTRHGTVIGDCTVWLRSGTDTLALVHGTLHCLGYEHVPAAPAGHVMNRSYSRITLDDFRGLP